MNISNKIITYLLLVWIIISIGQVYVVSKHMPATGKATALIKTNVKQMSGLYTKYDKYSPAVDVAIQGSSFTYNGLLELDIINANKSVHGYPKNISLDDDGDFTELLKTGNLSHGNYTIIATDSNPVLSKNKTIEILPQYIGLGRIYSPFGKTVDLIMKVYDQDGNLVLSDDGDYNLSFKYGMEYDVHITPRDLSGIDKVIFNVMVNEGDFANLAGLDSIEVKYSDNIDGLHMDKLTAIVPNVIPNSMHIYFNHDARPKMSIFKCLVWNFTARRCDGNWTFVKNITEGTKDTDVIIYPTDPGFAVGAYPFCGDGVWDTGETLKNCPEDYPIPSLLPEKARRHRPSAAETCNDSTLNQDESDTDCGGICPACDIGKTCKTDSDCISSYCHDNICSTPVEIEKPAVDLPFKLDAKPIIVTLLAMIILLLILSIVIQYVRKKR